MSDVELVVWRHHVPHIKSFDSITDASCHVAYSRDSGDSWIEHLFVDGEPRLVFDIGSGAGRAPTAHEEEEMREAYGLARRI
jgi:hypothetical protein